MKKVKGLENGLNLSKHMADHIYMFSGDSGIVRFRAYRYIISELLDWFGKDIKFADYSEDEEILMLLDIGVADKTTTPRPNHNSRKALTETVSFI